MVHVKIGHTVFHVPLRLSGTYDVVQKQPRLIDYYAFQELLDIIDWSRMIKLQLHTALKERLRHISDSSNINAAGSNSSDKSKRLKD